MSTEKLYQLIEDLRVLKTESANPRTENLSLWAKDDLALALRKVAEVEIRSLEAFRRALLKKVRTPLFRLHHLALEKKQKIFLVGAGASGRMALFVKRAFLELRPEDPFTALIEPVIAGGDAALIHAVPGFEDDPQMAELQLERQGFQAEDTVIGFSASGRAPFVLSALAYAKARGGEALLVHANPERALMPYPSLSLYTEAPAVAGSTRLSPTSLMMIAAGVWIEEKSEDLFASHLTVLQDLLENFPFELLAKFVSFEAKFLQEKGRMIYEISAPSFVEQIIFHDLTERTPTAGFFPLRPFKDWQSFRDQVPFAYPIFRETSEASAVWQRLLGKKEPFCLALEGLPETAKTALFDFDFSQKAKGDWEAFLKKEKHPFTLLVIHLFEGNFSLRLEANSLKIQQNLCKLPPYFQAIFLKIILNTYSTGLMARLGLIYKNRMSHLMPTNEKLIARAILQIEERLREQGMACPLEKIIPAFLEKRGDFNAIEQTIQVLQRLPLQQ